MLLLSNCILEPVLTHRMANAFVAVLKIVVPVLLRIWW